MPDCLYDLKSVRKRFKYLYEQLDLKIGDEINPRTARGFQWTRNRIAYTDKHVVPVNYPIRIEVVDILPRNIVFELEFFSDYNGYFTYKECINANSLLCGDAYIEKLYKEEY